MKEMVKPMIAGLPVPANGIRLRWGRGGCKGPETQEQEPKQVALILAKAWDSLDPQEAEFLFYAAMCMLEHDESGRSYIIKVKWGDGVTIWVTPPVVAHQGPARKQQKAEARVMWTAHTSLRYHRSSVAVVATFPSTGRTVGSTLTVCGCALLLWGVGKFGAGALAQQPATAEELPEAMREFLKAHASSHPSSHPPS